jgi:N-ethylmaleimide reductase
MTSPLFSPFRLGALDLPNRVVMAPMTRSRAIGAVPNALMADYYRQRAGAGLIITEGTAPSPDGLGYARIPGLFDAAQVEGWRGVTDAVHAAGGRIAAQLMHVGRIAHGHNLPPGAQVRSASDVAANGMMYTDQAGPQPYATPRAMDEADLRRSRDEWVAAARNARAAGFDAVELHGANGYLLEQFLHPHTNRRRDGYGGSVAARTRYLAETAAAVADALGADRVGVRLSPFSTFNDLPHHDEIEAQYVEVARALRGLMYLHVVANPHDGFAATAAAMRRTFGGPVILNGNFDRARAEAALAADQADLISFGRPFIANPDLVRRLLDGVELAAPDPSTFYTPGAAGYTDYPTA